jgi:mono/diheme cytochrome c family protein
VAGIPEHLLKRAQERRDALAGKTAESGDAGALATNLPAKTVENKPAANAPVVSAPPPPPPDPAYVVAAKSRKKIPFWAMATLSLLPLWAFLYVLAVKPQERVVEGPLAVGVVVFGTCAGCHGADGAGGA